MERMKLERKNKNLKENLDIERRGHLQLARRVKQLEEENRNLKEDYKALGILNDEIRRVNENLREENKKLKEEVEKLRSTYIYNAKQVRDVC